METEDQQAGPVTGRGPAGSGPATDRLRVAHSIHEAAVARFEGDADADRLATTRLEAWAALPGSPVPDLAAGALVRAVQRAWDGGWQPADVRRAVARRLPARVARLAVAVIVADAERYRDHPDADFRWTAQLDEMDGSRPGRPAPGGPAGGRPTPVATWARHERLGAAEAAGAAVDLLAALWRLPTMPRLIDPPDRWGMPGARSHHIPEGLDPKILGRVRALLAKAESTVFGEEAEAYTAKAQHLMARHSLDRAALDGTGGTSPEGRRIGVDDPYAAAKALLLSQVADAGRCRVVWSREFGFSTAFGYPTDLDQVEVLYTSLLVQATTAMVGAGSGPGDRRRRSRSFRQAFLVAYATRIGQRLAETDAVSVAEAASVHGDALLPVLASRLAAVDDVRDQAFPAATHTVLPANDRAGWTAGTVAADSADLGSGPELAAVGA